jgi:hypothetical protein
MATLLAFAALGVGVAFSAPASIVGRWQQTHTCRQLVHALKEFHLRRIAPSVVGDYFPNKTPQQLARKRHVCSGAKPQRHSHFFTSNGHFGSVNQHGQQVDNCPYRLINSRTLQICPPDGPRFHYQISTTATGEVLALDPVITRHMRRQALAHPLRFSKAGYAVAVAYPGHTWARVPCRKWC